MTDVRDLARKYKMSLLLVEEADEENETQLVLLGNTEESTQQINERMLHFLEHELGEAHFKSLVSRLN